MMDGQGEPCRSTEARRPLSLADARNVRKLVSQRADACSVPLSYLAFAVHGLQPINAFHGRQKGDDMLPSLITNAKQLLHANDELFGIGGRECLVLLWDQPLESARTTATQIPKVVREMDLAPGDGSSPRLAMNPLGASDTSRQEEFSRVEVALNQSHDLEAHQVVVVR